MNSESLIRSLRDFLAGSSQAVVLEDGMIAFDLAYAEYSVSGEQGKCLLDDETQNNNFRLSVQRLEARPSKLANATGGVLP